MLPVAHGGRQQRSGLFSSIFTKDTPVLEPIPLSENSATFNGVDEGYWARRDVGGRSSPLPPPPRRTDCIKLLKKRGFALGVRFLADSVCDDGAVVDSVEPFGVAWRHGLKWGDVICSVRIVASGKEFELTCGEDAAKALRPAHGYIELTIRKRTIKREDHAASLIQAHVLGYFNRDTMGLRGRSATVISSHWRRWCAIMDARALRADAQEDYAAEAIQGAWRWRIRRWERRLALEYLQETARAFVGKLRSGQRARKRRCIRAPPCLTHEDEL